MSIARSDLHAYARVGVIAKLHVLEGEIETLFAEFPDVFIERTAPQLVKPELRNGHKRWPPVLATNGTGPKTDIASTVLPYLREHGPIKQSALRRAVGYKSSGSLSSALRKLIAAGQVERQARGLYAATAKAASKSGATPKAAKRKAAKRKWKTLTKDQIHANRKNSQKILSVLAEAGRPLDGTALASASGFSARLIAPLVRRGYIHKSKRGYVRTKKAFVV